MTKQEFVKKATDYGYDEETINQFIEVVEESEGVDYGDIFLLKRRIDVFE